MKLTIEMPWERELSVNLMRFGKPSPKARGKWKKRRVRRPHVQGWMERLAWELRVGVGLPQRYDSIWFVLPASVVIDFRWPDKRRRDTHNYFKVIADAVATGLGIDDKDILISARSAVVDGENPGFTIEVRDSAEE